MEPSGGSPSFLTGNDDASLSSSVRCGALWMSLGRSVSRSLRHPQYPGWRLGHLRQRRPSFWVGILLGVIHPHSVEDLEQFLGWMPPPLLAGLQLQVGLPLPVEPPSLGGMVGASLDLQAERHQQGEGTDLVAPAQLSPNGNRCPLGSIPCRSRGPPICTQSPARIVSPCTGDTRAGHYS